MVVAQALKLPIHGVLVPEHAFARWDDGSVRIDIETTAKGVATDDGLYRARTPWADADAEVNSYAKSLTIGQFAAELHAMAADELTAVNRFPDAMDQWQAADALWPDQPRNIMRKAAILARSGQQQQAVDLVAPLQTSKSPEVRTNALLLIAGTLEGMQQHQKALSVAMHAFRDAPKYSEKTVLSVLANCYRSLRRFDEACAYQKLATLYDPTADDVVNLAIMYKNAHHLDDAVECLQAALRMNPESWCTRVCLAGYLILDHQDDAGWKMFKTVEMPRENQDSYYLNLAWFYAVAGKKSEFLDNLDHGLGLSQSPGVLDYVAQEVDFDAYRSLPEFVALINKHKARLEAAKP